MSDDTKVSRPPEADLYELLAKEFDHVFHDSRGGASFDYITGEQCISRLNQELGFMAWGFRIIEHGIHAEADECWVLGEIVVTIGDRVAARQQFGSQKVKRSRSSGTPLDLGFDLKGAATDCLKKCASLVGVALYLWEKDAPRGPVDQPPGNDRQGQNTSGHQPMTSSGPSGGSAVNESFSCEECGDLLTETRFKDGTNWAPAQLAVFGRRKHSRILCMTHYREENARKRKAEEDLQRVPF